MRDHRPQRFGEDAHTPVEHEWGVGPGYDGAIPCRPAAAGRGDDGRLLIISRRSRVLENSLCPISVSWEFSGTLPGLAHLATGMNSSSPHTTPDQPALDKFASLLEMGFERLDPAPITTESICVGVGTHKVSQVRPAMGSFVTISVLHRSEGLAEDAVGKAFEEMDRVVAVLNRFDGSSALACLNDTGRIENAPPELARVVGGGLGYHRLTSGAFDITVKPIIDLFRDPQTYEPRTPPSAAELSEARALVGVEHIGIHGRDLSLSRAGMGLTLDGIAKGYIVDAMADALRAHGATRFLINAGGDIRAAGDRGDALPWTIAIRDPEDPAPSWDSESWQRSVVTDLIRITNGAVATSGSYEVYFDRERLAHHIVQGRTGRSPDHAMSVTVTAATTMEADALATAVFVLGPGDGVGLINGIAGCECLIIGRQGQQVRSDGWSAMAASAGEPGRRAGGAETEANERRDG